jgi:hypothetical protein
VYDNKNGLAGQPVGQLIDDLAKKLSKLDAVCIGDAQLVGELNRVQIDWPQGSVYRAQEWLENL